MLLSNGFISAPVVLAAAAFAAGLATGAGVAPFGDRRGLDTAVAPASAAPAPGEVLSWRAALPADVLRVLDGDTFEARVHLWPGLDVTTRVRLRGVDAPELKARCGEERTRAEHAREALRNILAQGGVAVVGAALDKYGGRVLADASTRLTPDVGAALLDAGHVRRYAGARRDGWC